MSMLTPWLELEKNYKGILVLGNGASVAVDEVFLYKSLREIAEKKELITRHVSSVFEYLGTEDFELVLSMLWHTFRINQALKINDGCL